MSRRPRAIARGSDHPVKLRRLDDSAQAAERLPWLAEVPAGRTEMGLLAAMCPAGVDQEGRLAVE